MDFAHTRLSQFGIEFGPELTMKFALLTMFAAMIDAAPSLRQSSGLGYPGGIHSDCLVFEERRLLLETGVPFAHLDCGQRRELLEALQSQKVAATLVVEDPFSLLSTGQGIDEALSADESF